MDYKRNARYFSKTFDGKMILLAVVGGIVAVMGGLLWWYVYLGNFAIFVEIAAVAGAILLIGTLSQRPSEKDLFEQIEAYEKRFREEALERFSYPADTHRSTRLIWGFVPGEMKKTAKNGKLLTDRVEFALLYLKKGELAVYRQTVSLLRDESEIADIRLSRKSLTATIDQEAGTLCLKTSDETLTLSVFAPDYRLEEFLQSPQ
ncbi:MAG: hypothetical protein ACI3YH_08730 [Eubacteriales bacterium]